MFNGQIGRSLLLSIVIRIKGNNYFTRISFVESIKGTIFINTNLRYRRMFVDFCHCKIFDCKSNLSTFCNVAVFSGFSVENESMLAFVI